MNPMVKHFWIALNHYDPIPMKQKLVSAFSGSWWLTIQWSHSCKLNSFRGNLSHFKGYKARSPTLRFCENVCQNLNFFFNYKAVNWFNAIFQEPHFVKLSLLANINNHKAVYSIINNLALVLPNMRTQFVYPGSAICLSTIESPQ